MPSPIVVNLNAAEQARLREQRHLRLLCPLLRLHILLLLAQRRSPTEIADWLLCSRSSVYEVATRWSCATLALSLQVRRGLNVSAETVRRWLHGLGWRWKRTKLIAPDNDPERAAKLARTRLVTETLRPRQALLFADEL